MNALIGINWSPTNEVTGKRQLSMVTAFLETLIAFRAFDRGPG
jgi:hypothetical protein